MLPTPFTLNTGKRQNRSLIQDVTPFLNNIIFQYTNPLPFETEPHTVHPQSNSHTFLARILQKWYISDTICKNLARILDFRQTCQILADQTFLAD